MIMALLKGLCSIIMCVVRSYVDRECSSWLRSVFSHKDAIFIAFLNVWFVLFFPRENPWLDFNSDVKLGCKTM